MSLLGFRFSVFGLNASVHAFDTDYQIGKNENMKQERKFFKRFPFELFLTADMCSLWLWCDVHSVVNRITLKQGINIFIGSFIAQGNDIITASLSVV